MRKISLIASVVLILALAGAATTAASAATSSAKTHTGLFGKLLHHKAKPKATTAPAPAGAGQIIGDKKSHVYHLPGDKYMLPAQQNRVYFKTEAQAKAAGYRHAGSATPASGKKAAKRTAKSTGRGHTVKSHKTKPH